MKEESQVLLTFYGGGRLATRRSNASPKKIIRKVMKFSGEIDPETGKFSPLLNLTWYEKNNKKLPKNYFDVPAWARKYKEPKYSEITRKLRWTWEQVQAMLDTSVGNEKAWKKLSDEQKIQMHAEKCMLPGEFKVEMTVVE